MLNLQEWQISVELARAGQLDSGTVGDIDIAFRQKTATIRILDERDSDLPRYLTRADQQLTLEHELVHLKRRLAAEPWRNEAATVAETNALVLSTTGGARRPRSRVCARPIPSSGSHPSIRLGDAVRGLRRDSRVGAVNEIRGVD